MEEYLRYLSAAECRKNPGHVDFIPTPAFKPSHLPDCDRSLLVWALIDHKSKLTVKLTVNHVSDKRPPQFWPGITSTITASGYVTEVDTSNRNQVTITIDTAAHVVFNEEEAKSTKAQFYVNGNEVFQIIRARLLVVNPRKDISRIIFTLDIETFPCLATPSVLSSLEYALSPSVLPNVNDKISLWQSVVARYKTNSFPWLSFLFSEIKCLRNIKYVSDKTRVLETEIHISDVLLYDIILFVISLNSHLNPLVNFLEDIVRRNDTNMETAERPFITLSKDDNVAKSLSKLSLHQFINTDTQSVTIINSDFTKQHNKKLYHLMTCFINSPVDMDELNKALPEYCVFAISARCKQILFVPQKSVHIPGTLSLGVSLVFTIPLPPVHVPEKMSLEVKLHDVVEEVDLRGEEEKNLPGANDGNLRVLEEENSYNEDVNLHGANDGNLRAAEEENSYNEDVNLHDVEENHSRMTILISHPHGMPPQITIGQLKDSHNSSEMNYTNPSCEGSSGGPVWIIPREPSLKYLENMQAITHSSFNSKGGFGN